MVKHSHANFLLSEVRKKPNTLKKRDASEIPCPFCSSFNEDEIIDSIGTITLVKNKYATIEHSFQTVLVETDKCNENISTYPPEYMERLIRFGIKHWFKMKNSGKYSSVIFYKNHGPLSGGSLSHAHMQIVGFKDLSYEDNILDEYFEGRKIVEIDSCILNLSSTPKIGSTEFNIIMCDEKDMGIFSHMIQKTVDYLLNHFNSGCNSFNLFFYHHKDKIICKAVPRFVTSPMFVGYSIPCTNDLLNKTALKVKELYFQDIL